MLSRQKVWQKVQKKNAFEPQKNAAKHVAKVAAKTVAQIAALPGYNLPMGSYTILPGFCIGRLPDRFFGIFGQILRTFFSDILNICSRAFHELLQSQLLLFQELSLGAYTQAITTCLLPLSLSKLSALETTLFEPSLNISILKHFGRYTSKKKQ